MIPPKQVQEILDAVRIEEVVEEFVTLKRRGVNLIGLCPFHGEKTPSFNVNPTRNIFICFGCGKKGDAITFLKEHESMSYPDALRWLAKKYHIQIQEVERTPEQLAEMQLTDSLYIVNDFALTHFQEQLFNTDEGRSVALEYFRHRGLREDTIRTFGLGYAPDQRDLLLRHARSTGHNLDLLKKVGLCSADGSRDFFRGRVMFAIHNMSGKVAAFAGRIMSSSSATGGGQVNAPKYINSPETEIYVKNRTLYGLFQARKAIRQLDECLLTEGYMDVISLYQAGIQHVVASSGTSLTEGQLQLIRRNTANLKILYDGDAAGIKAALRGLDLALEQDLNVKICLLPDGHDPDSYIRQYGGEAFQEYANTQAKDFILFKTELLTGEAAGDPIKRAGLVKDIVGSIARIPDPVKRSIYLKQCAARMEMSEDMLTTEANKIITTTLKKREEKAARQPGAASDSPPSDWADWPVDIPPPSAPEDALLPDFGEGRPNERPMLRGDDFQERDLIRLLVQFGDRMLEKEGITVGEYILADIEESLSDFDNPLYAKIASECHALLLAGQTFDQHHFTQHALPEVRDLAIDLLTAPWEYSPNWEAMWNYPLQNQPMPEFNFDPDMKQALHRFKLRKVQKMCVLNQARIKSAADAGQMDEMLHYMKIQQKLNETRNAIALQVGTVVLVK